MKWLPGLEWLISNDYRVLDEHFKKTTKCGTTTLKRLLGLERLL